MITKQPKQQGSLLADQARSASGPVECLGIRFENEAARRTHFLEILKEKLKDTQFRGLPGFPIGADEDILRLSDPPYYTACPNPFLQDFVRQYGKEYDLQTKYSREPFAADVSEGKNDPIYNAHSYHTKVPHKAIMRYVLHYTAPGDLVFDGFCGTGMAGVAAGLCGDRSAITELGYAVTPDGKVLDVNQDVFSRLGARIPILNDLSPAATLIADWRQVLFPSGDDYFSVLRGGTVGPVGMWESHSDFQGRWKGWKTWGWFSRLSTDRHFHRALGITPAFLPSLSWLARLDSWGCSVRE